MKAEIELIAYRDEEDVRTFINYLDWRHGNDVCCQVIEGKLFKSQFDEIGNELDKREITLPEFIEMIIDRL